MGNRLGCDANVRDLPVDYDVPFCCIIWSGQHFVKLGINPLEPSIEPDLSLQRIQI